MVELTLSFISELVIQFYLRNWWFNFIRGIGESILFAELLIQFLFSELLIQFYFWNWSCKKFATIIAYLRHAIPSFNRYPTQPVPPALTVWG